MIQPNELLNIPVFDCLTEAQRVRLSQLPQTFTCVPGSG